MQLFLFVHFQFVELDYGAVAVFLGKDYLVHRSVGFVEGDVDRSHHALHLTLYGFGFDAIALAAIIDSEVEGFFVYHLAALQHLAHHVRYALCHAVRLAPRRSVDGHVTAAYLDHLGLGFLIFPEDEVVTLEAYPTARLDRFLQEGGLPGLMEQPGERLDGFVLALELGYGGRTLLARELTHRLSIAAVGTKQRSEAYYDFYPVSFHRTILFHDEETTHHNQHHADPAHRRHLLAEDQDGGHHAEDITQRRHRVGLAERIVFEYVKP